MCLFFGVQVCICAYRQRRGLEFPNHREFGYENLYGSLYSLISDASFSYSALDFSNLSVNFSTQPFLRLKTLQPGAGLFDMEVSLGSGLHSSHKQVIAQRA